jgi:mycothiol synthase
VVAKKFRIREFRPSDYPPLERIHNALYPAQPYFRKRAEYEDSCYGRTRHKMKRFVAESPGGEVVGVAEYKHLFFQYHPRKFALDIEVPPPWQRKGIGGMLYDRLLEEVAKRQADTVWTLVLSTQEGAIRFLGKRGFVEKRRTFESRLDLRSFGTSRSASGGKHEQRELTVRDLAAEFQRNPDTGRKLKELEDSGAADVPGSIVESPMSFHDYEIVILKSPIMIWDGSFIAKEGDNYVGESSLHESGIDGVIDQGFTVVRPSHRGRGVARAIKIRTIEYAKAKGMKHIRTHNDSENHPMLAVNRKLGFVKTAEWITFEKRL